MRDAATETMMLITTTLLLLGLWVIDLRVQCIERGGTFTVRDHRPHCAIPTIQRSRIITA